MPTNITDAERLDEPDRRAADPDPADKTYVLTVAQGLANRTAFLTKRLGLIGHGGLWRESTTEIGYKGLVFASAAHGVLSIASGSVDVSSLVGGLANSTWYYLYAYDNAGAATIECNTTAPIRSQATERRAAERLTRPGSIWDVSARTRRRRSFRFK
jgi:hypothetical protein